MLIVSWFAWYYKGVKYNEYLTLQSQVERLYDFHPDLFDKLSSDEYAILHNTLLFDTSDEEYPESIESFFYNTVAESPLTQTTLLSAAQHLYNLSNGGDVRDTLKDSVSFPSSLNKK